MADALSNTVRNIPSELAGALMRAGNASAAKRIYVQSLLGRTTPITEKDLSRQELEHAAQTIDTARRNRVATGIPANQRAHFNSGGGTISAYDSIMAGQEDLGRNNYGIWGITKYEPGPNGGHTIVDNYDWKNSYDDQIAKQVDRDGPLKTLRDTLFGPERPQHRAERLAILLARNTSIPIRVNVPKSTSNPVSNSNEYGLDADFINRALGVK